MTLSRRPSVLSYLEGACDVMDRYLAAEQREPCHLEESDLRHLSLRLRQLSDFAANLANSKAHQCSRIQA